MAITAVCAFKQSFFIIIKVNTMVRPFHWYDPMLTRRMRVLLTALIWIAWLTILLLQYENVIRMLAAIKRFM